MMLTWILRLPLSTERYGFPLCFKVCFYFWQLCTRVKCVMNIFTLIAPSSSSSTPVGYRILPKQTPTILMVCVCVCTRESLNWSTSWHSKFLQSLLPLICDALWASEAGDIDVLFRPELSTVIVLLSARPVLSLRHQSASARRSFSNLGWEQHTFMG